MPKKSPYKGLCSLAAQVINWHLVLHVSAHKKPSLRARFHQREAIALDAEVDSRRFARDHWYGVFGSYLVALLLVPPAAAAPAKAPVPERIEVSPTRIDLHGRRAFRQLIVTGYFHGEARDLTRSASYSATGPVKAAQGRVQAAGDGDAGVLVEAGEKSVRVPVHTAGFTKPDPVSFKFETLAVLTKQGCATGSCHGSPHGKGGFSLSLFGYDPRIDRISLTRDGFNRRVNIIEPSESLLLKKPLLELSHGGGRRLRHGEVPYETLRGWISEGASTDLPAVDCRKIEIAPAGSRVLHAPNLRQQLSVLATFSDGSVRDVTAIATYDSSHPAVAAVGPDGEVTGQGRGQAAISVRYLDQLQSIYFTVIEDQPGFVWSSPPENGWIDRLVDAKLRQLQYLPSPTCTDAVFLRRVYLDLTGLLPPPDHARTFPADHTPDKRGRLIDELLGTEEYARFWAMKKADLMRVTPRRLKNGGADTFAEWIVDQVRKNTPYDRFAREILTATGTASQHPAASYFLAIPKEEERTEMTAQIFMGSRLECAKCHNHPFENWTMRDYYRLGAVFARTQVTGTEVKLVNSGETALPTTGEAMVPWGAPEMPKDPAADRRTAFAEWLTKPGNPFFARVEVNRIWAELLGRGIVDPVDDLRSSNPPSNVPLLDALAAEFEKSGYDRKHMIRLICNSRAYQRSSQASPSNKLDETLFSHARVRLLSAEQLKDAVALAAHAASRPDGDRSRSAFATQRPYPEHSAFTTAFGQPQRETACTCERQNAPTLLQALELLNGSVAYEAASTGAGRYAKLPDAQLIEELYLSACSRLPNEHELTVAMEYLHRGSDRETAVADLVWTVVNTQEFLFQH